MARTKDENYDVRKETILKAAARVFADKGFLRTNIIEIGEASGASKSRMYHYFPSKEALLAQLLITHVESLHDAVLAAASDAPPGVPRLRRLIETHVEQYVGAFAEHKLLLSEPGNLPEEDRVRLQKAEARLVRLMTSVLREVAPQRLRPDPAARVHAMLVYGMLNWTFTWYRPDGPVSPSALAEAIIGMALEGLAGSAATHGASAVVPPDAPDPGRKKASVRAAVRTPSGSRPRSPAARSAKG